MDTMRYTGIQNWQVLQQIDGFAGVTITGEIDGWLKNPVLEAEISCAAAFYGVRLQIAEEDTGRALTPWVEAKAENGVWSCEITGIPVGGLYCVRQQLVFYSEEKGFSNWAFANVVKHIGVGDVYLIAGQSNAVGWAKGLMYDPVQLGVSMFEQGSGWELACQPMGGRGSAFFTFGKQLNTRLGYPIGLIPRAIGGAPITDWMDGGCHMERLKKEEIGRIKGVLWYQGCTEANDGGECDYAGMFENVVEQFRKKFEDDTLPVITFQLNRLRSFDASGVHDAGYDRIREIQRTMPKRIPNVYVLPTIDLTTMSDSIHNSMASNRYLGERAAWFAMDVIYGRDKIYEVPDIERIEQIGGKTLKLIFQGITSTLDAFGVAPWELSVCAEDAVGVNPIVGYRIEGNRLLVECERALEGEVFVKSQYGSNPKNVIIDAESQIPILCFSNVKSEKNV